MQKKKPTTTHKQTVIPLIDFWAPWHWFISVIRFLAIFSGFYCLRGSAYPQLCEAGSYCDRTGLEVPAGHCAAGYYCPTGSSEAHATPCPSGHYCPLGTPLPLPCPPGTMKSEPRWLLFFAVIGLWLLDSSSYIMSFSNLIIINQLFNQLFLIRGMVGRLCGRIIFPSHIQTGLVKVAYSCRFMLPTWDEPQCTLEVLWCAASPRCLWIISSPKRFNCVVDFSAPCRHPKTN